MMFYQMEYGSLHTLKQEKIENHKVLTYLTFLYGI